MEEKERKEKEQRVREIIGKWFLDLSKWIITSFILTGAIIKNEVSYLYIGFAFSLAFITYIAGLYTFLYEKNKGITFYTIIIGIGIIAISFIPYIFETYGCCAMAIYSIIIIIIIAILYICRYICRCICKQEK